MCAILHVDLLSMYERQGGHDAPVDRSDSAQGKHSTINSKPQ